MSLRNRLYILLLFYCFNSINMDTSDAFIGTTALNFDHRCHQCPPKMMPWQSTPTSATEPQPFDRTIVDLGRPRLEEVVDQRDSVQRIDGSQLETRVSSCESFGSRTFSNTTNECRKLAIDTTNSSSTSLQPNVIRPRLQRNTTHQVTSLWPPSCADPIIQ